MELEQRIRLFLNKVAEKFDYRDHQIVMKLIYNKGANYTSQIFFPVLSAPGKPDLKLFAKTAILSDEIRSILRFDIFNTEIVFFSELLPKYRELEDAYNVPKEERFLMPKYYAGSRDYMNEILVLENLAERGFQDFNRFDYFEWDYASKCVEQLAMFHSLSMAHAEKNPKEFERLTKDMRQGFPCQYIKHLIDRCTKLSINVCHEDNKEKLEKFIKNTVNEKTFETFAKLERRPGLIHGDFRPSNIMHRIIKNGILQVTILDYQIVQRGNPLFDLMYFIVCGSDSIFRAKYFHQLLDHYYDALSKALQRLDVAPEEVYSKKDFDADVKLFLPCGLMLAVLLLPLVTVDESKAPDFNDFVNGSEKMKNSNHIFKQRLNDVVNDFIKLGVL